MVISNLLIFFYHKALMITRNLYNIDVHDEKDKY